METRNTAYGTLFIGENTELFAEAAKHINTVSAKTHHVTIGLSGGNSPKLFFRWMVETDALDEQARERVLWLTSDERFVARTHEESNFGNADKELFNPLEIPESRRLNWPTQVDPHSAPIVFNRKWDERFGAERCFDLCFLGMGDDGHTASLFPGSPLLGMDIYENFTCVNVPDKGWRLTITPAGLKRCRKIVVMVHGKGKAERLKAVLEGAYNPDLMPIQILRDCAEQTVWLVDNEAASLLSQ